MLKKKKKASSPLLRAGSKTSSFLKREWSKRSSHRRHCRQEPHEGASVRENTHPAVSHTLSRARHAPLDITSAWGRGARCLVRQGLHVRWARHQLPGGAGCPREGEARVAFWGWVSTRGRGARCLLGLALHARERRALPGGRGLLRAQREIHTSFALEPQGADEILASQSSVRSVRSDWRLITLKSK